MSPNPFARLLGVGAGATTLWTFGAAFFNAMAGVCSARALGPYDRGVLAVLLAVVGLTTVFGSLGSNVVVRGDLPRLGAPLLHGYLHLTKRLLILFYLPLTVVSVWIAHLTVGFSAASVPVVPLLVYSVATFEWFQTQEGLSGAGRILTVARTSAMGSVVLAASMATVFALGATSSAVIGSYAAGMVVQAVVARWKLARMYPRTETTAERTGDAYFIRAGWKTLGYHFGQNLIFRLDRYLLAAIAGPSQAGLYAVAATPAELIRLPIQAAGQYTLLGAARGESSLRSVLRRALGAVVVAFVAAAVSAVVAPPLIPVVYGSGFADSRSVFLVLILGQVLLAPYMILSRALVGFGGRGTTSVIGLVGVAALVGGVLWLVPAYGALGCAAAAGVAYAAMSVVSLPLTARAAGRSAR